MQNIDFLKTRRTIRQYTAKPVDDDLLNQVLEAGCRTSTTGNMQVYSIIITRDKKNKEILLPLHFGQKMVTEAPVVLTFCADFNRFSKWCRLRGADAGYDNFLSFMTAAIDALLVAQTVCIAAEAKGLGICYIGTTTYMAHKIIEALELPKGVVPVTTVTLGWPAENPEQVDRLPLSAVLHKETYKDYSEADINGYYVEKENRADVRYKKTDNIYFSNTLLQVLKDQGFMNQ
jgi:FMN reductase (NADPH)